MSGAVGPVAPYLSAGEESERQRSPDAAEAVHRHCADRIVDPQPLEQFDAQHDDDAGDAAEQDGAGRADPVAGAGDGDQAGEEAVDGEAQRPISCWECRRTNIAVRPAAQAASVVLAATRPMPWQSIADSVLPGLKPYQPNHRIRPPAAAIVRSCGSIGPPPSRLNLRPSRGPSTMAPASAMKPPIVCTTVEPAKSWKFMPERRQEVVGAAHRARKPSGPHAQWPMIG